MFVTFDSLPDSARIWVYQADREITAGEQHQIEGLAKIFLDRWSAHGQPLSASLQIEKGYFLLLACDDQLQAPSGCAIDQSVAFLRHLDEQLGINFFDRTIVALWVHDSIQVIPLSELKIKAKAGMIPDGAHVFNTLVQTKGELQNWIIPLKDSWLGRYTPQAAP